ncbi:MAG: hypothetical protein SNI45_03050 [Rikenellaceae bacterium]
MKKILLSFVVMCAGLMVSCGNAEVNKINQLVIDATEQTMAAESPEQVVQIALTLQDEMDKIAAEAGDEVSLGKSVDEALEKYQEAAAAKLAEFGINF